MGLFMRLNRPGGAPVRYLLLAGVETGIVGGVVALAWMVVHSLWSGLSPWAYPNLLASTFYGETTLRPGFHWATLSGLALALFVSGLLGIAFGLVVQDRSRRLRVVFLGLAFALIWYYVSYGLLWRRVNRLVSLYSPERAVVAAHLLYGVVLGMFPGRLIKLLSGATSNEEPAEVTPPAASNC
jgi:hypothetical protein